MSAPRDAERVLADVEKALDKEIEHCERTVKNLSERMQEMDARIQVARHTLAALDEVRRAARGGRDGGAE